LAPGILHESTRRMRQRGEPVPDDVLKEFNIFVTCRNNDQLDLHYLPGPEAAND
jgi:hypothetical protein